MAHFRGLFQMNWQDIRDNILNRIAANKKRLASLLQNEEIRPLIQRICHDDEQRLAACEQWITYHD